MAWSYPEPLRVTPADEVEHLAGNAWHVTAIRRDAGSRAAARTMAAAQAASMYERAVR